MPFYFKRTNFVFKKKQKQGVAESAEAGKNTTQHHVEKNRQDSGLQLRRGKGPLCILPVSLLHREHRCIHYLQINMIFTMCCLFRPHNRQNNGLEPVPGTSLPRFRRGTTWAEAAGFCPRSSPETGLLQHSSSDSSGAGTALSFFTYVFIRLTLEAITVSLFFE